MCFIYSDAQASTEDFDVVLDDLITQNGAFDGEKGVVYSNIVYFEEYPSLLTVSVRDDAFFCEVYDNIDGIQCTDILNIPLGTASDFLLSTVKSNEKDLIMLSFGKEKVFYTIRDDTFCVEYNIDYKQKTDIISKKNDKYTAYSSRRTLYNFLNGLKRERIEKYKILNCINTISDTEKEEMLKTIKACADIMDFDINEFDYNTLVRYILCTNQNFRILTEKTPDYTADSGGISIVSMEYIDSILEEVFGITPRHPAINSLVSRGFCTDNGYYYYKNIFTTFYATDVIDIEAMYNLGEGIYYIVFKDIYRQGNVSFPEYSYAILKKNDNKYNLLKLGMGRKLLTERELIEIAPVNIRSSYAWNNTSEAKEQYSIILILLLLVCVSCGVVAIVCGIVLVFREFKDK